MMSGEKVLIVTTMKNEAPYILEWVAHHLALGVDQILVFTNDCDDGTDRMLDRLEQIAPVFHRPNPKSLFRDKGNWQVMALRYAQMFNIYRDAGWIYHTDADEFLQIAPGAGTLEDFHNAAVARSGPFDAVSFTSIPFSSDGRTGLEDRPVTELYRRRNKHYETDAGRPLSNAVKTMFRNALPFDIRRNHRPRMEGFSAAGHVWINGSATIMPPDFTDGSVKAIDPLGSTDLAQMNHYAIKCADAFLVKLDRGDVAGVSRLDADSKYWENYNTPGDAETRFTGLRPAAQRLMAGFLADPVLGALHQAGFAAHRARAAQLRRDPAWQEMTRRLGSLATPALQTADDWARSRAGAPLPPVASFWTGDPLTYIEHLVIRSFLDAGHPFVLYTLDDIGPVPEGTELRDASSIVVPPFPLGPGLRHNNAVYSDIFRLQMIARTGAIWADLDAYCLRPFLLPTDYAFGYEFEGQRIANGVLGLPPDSPALAAAISLVQQKNPIPPFFTRKRQEHYRAAVARGESFGFENFSWGASGPRLITHFLKSTGEDRFAMPREVFYPGPRAFNRPLLDPSLPDRVFETGRTVSVHFWGKTKAFLAEDYDGLPPRGCYLDRILRRHGVDPRDHPIRLSQAIAREDLRARSGASG